MKNHRVLLPILALVLCVVAGNLVFIHQAFQMDDSIYLLLAHDVVHSPWLPLDQPTYFEGRFFPDLASTEHPVPLTSYWMAFVARIGGGFSEVNLHLGFLIFPLILSCSMYLLARRLTGQPMLASLTLMFLPVVYVLSHTLMTDIPQLALWVAAVALFVNGVDSRRTSWIGFAAILVTLASFVSYASLCLVPLLGLYAVLHKNRRALLTILLLPTALLGLWLVLTYSHYGRLPPDKILGFYFQFKQVLAPGLLVRKCVYIVLAIGGVTIFPWGLLVYSRKRILLLALVCAALSLWAFGAGGYSILEKLLFVVFFGAGFVGVVETGGVVVVAECEGDLFLGAWFFGTMLFCATAYMTGAARYILPITPPLVLIWFRKLERTMDGRKFQRVVVTNLILGSVLALVLARADYQFAEIYRSFASTLGQSYSSGTGHTWFTGEWGFRAYLEQAGGEELGIRDTRPLPGDFLVVPTLATPYDTLFGNRLSLESIALVAPSRVQFLIPALPSDSLLVFTVGMPFAEKSDGMDLSIDFDAPDLKRNIYAKRIDPADGKRWAVLQIPLRDIAGKSGSVIFSAAVGGGTAEADWIAIARARICRPTGEGEVVLYDFRQHLKDARNEAVPNTQYHTPGNLPVFPMTVALEQQPATILRNVYSYRPAASIRMLDANVQAGFWSMQWGMLPFSFARDAFPLESIRVYNVTRKVDGYGESEPVWYPQ